ncbi:MAG: hypothetical protein KZQ80_15755 [Candidatus Thiodiazotropha sp. (ex Monitilora ramsayi)]|nr:hypothetical protein [Candidatus Thiodiazotropha sp. (ex Monitilora ramsayi)]
MFTGSRQRAKNPPAQPAKRTEPAATGQEGRDRRQDHHPMRDADFGQEKNSHNDNLPAGKA